MKNTIPESEENQFIEGLRIHGCSIFEYIDARKFLLVDCEEKEVSNRIISYLICLRIIPHSRPKWSFSLSKAFHIYFEHVSHYLSNSPEDPLSTVPIRYENVMRNDFSRTINWFFQIAASYQVDLTKFSNSLFRISRIYTILLHEHPEISYSQGYDRYGCIFLALLSRFCQTCNINIDFAEALTYHLVSAILSILPMVSLLDHQERLISHFQDLDKILMNYNLNQYNLLERKGVSIILFGVKWELLLFADEHPLEDILRLWDQIFGRLEDYQNVIMAMTISHINQVYIPNNDNKVLETVSHFSNWNVSNIIQ